MKDIIYHILIWCSGSDPNLLKIVPNSERIKQASYGALILIPAFVSLFSMTYAISTLTNNKLVFIVAGFSWSVIILTIDRFLISSLHKSESKKRQFYSGFVTRLILASLIGLSVSHPITLLFFEGSINQTLIEIKDKKIAYFDTVITKQIIITNHFNDSLFANLKGKKDRKACLEKLLTAEQSGSKISNECGYTSGIVNFGKRSTEIKGLK